MLDRWIHNALYAKYACAEDREYVIRKVKGEDFIIPIDYENTGVTMRNTIWSDGLHQFVQLKHNLQITTETLTSSFISNFGYIKFYQSIYGMTGTLGSVAEQNLLSSVYDVDFAKVPTFKSKDFEEFEGIVVDDDDWLNLVSMEAVFMIQQGRPVLIICKTIGDLMNIEENIRGLKEIEEVTDLNIRTYIDEDHSGVVKEELSGSEIVLATNIGGRGTDFKTTKAASEKGGLHVIISFLPANKRVEDQAFGRTARQGKPGTGQLIISESEVLSLGITITNETTFEAIKMERDEAEAKRLEYIKNVEVKKINFQDEMFAKFASLYRRFSKRITSLKHKYLTMDLKESWAFWLHKKNYNKANITGLQVRNEFQKFTRDVIGILGSAKHGEYSGGKITHNPYYSIRFAEALLQTNQKIDAKQELDYAIRLSVANPNLLYSAYLKLFEVEIELGNQIWIRFKKALAKTGFVGYIFGNGDYPEYKQRAKENLMRANNSLNVEINYITDTFLSKNSSKFSNILTVKAKDNLLLNHTYSRLYVLSTFQNHIDSLWKEIEKSGDNGTVIGSRIQNYLKSLGYDLHSDEAKLRNVIHDSELADFSMVGLDTIYRLDTVNDPSTEVIASAQGQIAGGFTLLGVGLFFPITCPLSVPIGNIMMTEGVTDILLEILDYTGKSIFNIKDYLKGKLISYGTSLATLGISQIFQLEKVANFAIKTTKSLSAVLRKCPVLKKVFEKLATYVDKITNFFIKFSSPTTSLSTKVFSTKFKYFRSLSAKAVEKSLERVVYIQVYQNVVVKIAEKALQGIKPIIEESVTKVLAERNMKQKLESLDTEKVRSLTVDIIKGTYGEIATEALEEIALRLLTNANFGSIKLNWFLYFSGMAIDHTSKLLKLNDYAEQFCKKFEDQSSKIVTSSNDTLVNVDESLNFITAQLTNKMFGICTGLVGKYFVFPVVKIQVGKGISTFKKGCKAGTEVVKEKYTKFSASFTEKASQFYFRLLVFSIKQIKSNRKRLNSPAFHRILVEAKTS
jgi:hypothetical protein